MYSMYSLYFGGHKFSFKAWLIQWIFTQKAGAKNTAKILLEDEWWRLVSPLASPHAQTGLMWMNIHIWIYRYMQTWGWWSRFTKNSAWLMFLTTLGDDIIIVEHGTCSLYRWFCPCIESSGLLEDAAWYWWKCTSILAHTTIKPS